MTKNIDSRTVREARAEARKTARKGERTYQQSLDDVARGRGFPHWSAFVAANPADPTGNAADQPIERAVSKPAKRSFADVTRSMIAGDDGIEDERARSAVVVAEAREEGTIMKAIVLQIVTFIAGAAFLMAMTASLQKVAPVMTDVHITLTTAMITLGAIAGLSTLIVLASMAIGDHPGMERRRTQAWKAMGWLHMVGLAGFLTVGFGLAPIDRFVTDHLHIGIGLAQQLSLVAMAAGTQIRNGVHRLMTLGAAMGPRAGVGSMADIEMPGRDAPDTDVAPPADRWHHAILGLGKTAVFSSIASLLIIIMTTIGAWLLSGDAEVDRYTVSGIGYALGGILMIPGAAFILAVVPLQTGIIPGGDHVQSRLRDLRARRAAAKAADAKT